jgi:hypothetical protein
LPRITEALATTCRSASIVPESLLANGSGQKFIARLPRDWSRSLHHGLKKARTESVQGYALPARFLCRFWYLCWNLTYSMFPKKMYLPAALK